MRTDLTDEERARGRALVKRYRCVYCRRTIINGEQLPVHEIKCEARYIVTMGWQMVIERAQRRERKLGIR